MRKPGSWAAPAVLAAALFAACSHAPPPKPVPELAFLTKSPIIAPAAEVTFDDEYKAPQMAPNVEHAQDVRPAEVVASWVDHRLQTQPLSPGRLTITLVDASVVEESLPIETGLTGALKREPQARLTGQLKWRMNYTGPLLTEWQAEGSAESAREILEEANLNQRDAAYADLIEGLAKSLDQRMEEQLKSLRDALAEAANTTTN